MPAKISEYYLTMYGKDELSAPAEKASEAVKTFTEKVKELRKEESEKGEIATERLFGNPEKLVSFLTGGGVAIAAAGLAAKVSGSAFEGLGESLQEYALAAAKGEVASKGLLTSLVEGVPVVGEFAKGFDKFNAGLTDYLAIRARLRGESGPTMSKEAAEAYYEPQRKFMEAFKEFDKELTHDLDRAGLEGPEAEISDLVAEMEAKRKKLGDIQRDARKINDPHDRNYALRRVADDFDKLDDEEGKRTAEIEKKWDLIRERLSSEHEARIASIEADGAAQRIAQTDALGAQLYQIESRRVADIVRAYNLYNELAKKDPSHAKQYLQQEIESVLTANEAAANASEIATEEHNRQFGQQIRKSGLDLASAEHDALMSRLRLRHDDFSAEMEDLRFQHERRIEEMKHNAEEEARTATWVEKLVIGATLAARIGAENQRFGAAGDLLNQQRNETNLERSLDLNKSRIEYLRQEGELGDRQAELQSRLLAISDQFKAKELDLLKIVRDGTRSYQDRLAAFLQIRLTQDQATRALRLAAQTGYSDAATATLDTNVGAAFYAPPPAKEAELPPGMQKLIDNTDPDELAKAFAKAFQDFLGGIIGVASGSKNN